MAARFCTAERCREVSRGLSEHGEQYPRSMLFASFLARLWRAGTQRSLLPGGARFRAYPRLMSPHRSAVQNHEQI